MKRNLARKPTKEANASSVKQQLPVIWLGWASTGRSLLLELYEKSIHKKRTFNLSKKHFGRK